MWLDPSSHSCNFLTGGDTDSTSALAGTLSGAYLGLSIIESQILGDYDTGIASLEGESYPNSRKLLSLVHDRGDGKNEETKWDFVKLVALCDELWEVSESVSDAGPEDEDSKS